MQSNPFIARTSREVRHDKGDSVDGLAPATRGAFDDAEDGCFTSAGRGHSARPSPGPLDAVAAHLFPFPEEAPQIGYRRMGPSRQFPP